MNIGFFYLRYYPVTTSYSVHGHQVVKALKRRGHRILSCSGDGNPDCENYPRTKWGAFNLAREADILYVRIASNPFLEKATLLRMVKPLSLPVVWEVNAPVEECRCAALDAGPEERLKIERFIHKENRKRKWLARLVDAGVGVSEVTRDYAKNFLGIKKAFSIPNGSDPELFDPSRCKRTVLSSLADYFKVLWTGNAKTPWQGVETAIEVAKRARQRGEKILFVFITGESLWTFPILDNLLVLREVSYSHIPHYIGACDVCLCLYKAYDWIEYGFYGSSLKLFDFMAAGKPIIASNMGQVADVIDHEVNGLLTNNDPEEILSWILELKKNPDKGESLGRQARRQVVEYYNWDRVARELEGVFAELTNRR